MDGIGGTLKNVILRKFRSGQLVVNSPLEFSEAVTKFILSIQFRKISSISQKFP